MAMLEAVATEKQHLPVQAVAVEAMEQQVQTDGQTLAEAEELEEPFQEMRH